MCSSKLKATLITKCHPCPRSDEVFEQRDAQLANYGFFPHVHEDADPRISPLQLAEAVRNL